MDTLLTPSPSDLPAHQRILLAAAQVFSEQGYKGATTRMIARRAGVNEVTIFRQFGSKQHLLASAVAQAATLTGLEAALSEGRPADLRQELTRLSRRYLERLAAERGLLLMTLSSAERLPEARQALGLAFQRQQSALAAYLRQKLDPAFAAELDLEHASRCLLDLLLAAALTQALSAEPPSHAALDATASALTDFFLRAIEGKSASGPLVRQLSFEWS